VALFGWGFLKYFLLYIPASQLQAAVWRGEAGSAPLIFAGGFVSIFALFLQLSSLCDMGRGAARILGVETSVNFRPIFFSISPLDFWNRWNITLGTWVRDYVTMPAMLAFGRAVDTKVILLGSFLLIGLWHGLSAVWAVFGLFNWFMVAVYTQARSALTLRSEKALRAFGYVSVFFLFWGNGVLTQAATSGDFRSSASGALLGTPWFQVPEKFPDIYPLFPLLLGAYFLLEFWRDKKGAEDVVFLFPSRVRYVLAAAFVFFFFGFANRQWWSPQSEAVPLYFLL
jgi:hypothetical protein